MRGGPNCVKVDEEVRSVEEVGSLAADIDRPLPPLPPLPLPSLLLPVYPIERGFRDWTPSPGPRAVDTEARARLINNNNNIIILRFS